MPGLGLGALIGLGQVPFSLVWVALPAIIVAFVLFRQSRRAFRFGWSIGVGYALVVMNWIVDPFFVDAAQDGWMAPFALAFMAAGFGLFWALAFALARRIAPGVGLGLALTWAGAEFTRSYILTGFPWALIGYVWVETPLLQVSALIGPQGLTLATLIWAALAAWFWTERRLVWGGTLVFVLALVLVGGYWQQSQPVPASASPGPMVRLVQPNASQKQKWDPQMMPVFYNRLLFLSGEPADTSLDLVIWPEVSVPFLLDDPTAPLWEVAGSTNGVPLILGIQRLDGAQAYNGLAVLNPEGAVTAQYDKYHLVPFGEFLPAKDLLAQLGLKAFTAKYGYGYTPGPGPRLLDLGALGRVLPLICYESIFPNDIRNAPARPDWLLLLTNDAWFGNFSGPYQHLAQARSRAVEFGLPMIRAANTGVSAVIDARGHIVAALPLNESGRLDARVPPALPTTLYARTGDAPVGLAIVLGLVALMVRRKYRLTPPG